MCQIYESVLVLFRSQPFCAISTNNPNKIKAWKCNMNDDNTTKPNTEGEGREDPVNMNQELGLKRKLTADDDHLKKSRTSPKDSKSDRLIHELPKKDVKRVKRKRNKSTSPSDGKSLKQNTRSRKFLSSTVVPKGDYLNGLKSKYQWLH